METCLSSFCRRNVLDEEIYSIFREKSFIWTKDRKSSFQGTDGIESILSPDYFEYVSENKARFKGETADYSVLYDPLMSFCT